MENNQDGQPLFFYEIDEYSKGFAEYKDNCWNFSIIAKNPQNTGETNEFIAGYIQGKLQGKNMIKASRDNSWKNNYLCDPGHAFPTSLPPSADDMAKAEKALKNNYSSLMDWLSNPSNPKVAKAISRLTMRMLGIYNGAIGTPIFKSDKSAIDEKTILNITKPKDDDPNDHLGYGDTELSLLDIYYINAQLDMSDAVSVSLESSHPANKPDHCSAFVKRTKDDIFWTHNSWCGYLSQSMTISYSIYDREKSGETEKDKIDFVTQNCYCAGQFGSNMDFGFNKYGICFNETTHRRSNYAKKETKGIWICWRAAAAEMFAQTIDEFYEYLTVENTGTYLNGYMLVDANTKETALIEMSPDRFVLFRAKEGEKYIVKDSFGKELSDKDYDTELITPEYIFGINYPISYDVVNDLGSTDNRPMRRVQFKERIGTVSGIETSKLLITYVGPDEPLSLYGRWDLGYGTTEYPKTIPDGAVDAKVYSANRVKELLDSLDFTPNPNGGKSSFSMLYGTAKINGKPFIWSESQWKEYKTKDDFIPDALEGAWNDVNLFMD